MHPNLIRWFRLCNNKELILNTDYSYDSSRWDFNGQNINNINCFRSTTMDGTSGNLNKSDTTYITGGNVTVIGWAYFTSCWIYPILFSETNANSTQYFNFGVYRTTTDGANGWLYCQYSNGGYYNFWNNATGGTNLGSLRNSWNNYAIVINTSGFPVNASDVSFYINGKAEPSSRSNASGTTPTQKTIEQIGRSYFHTGHLRFSDVRVYKTKLNQENVKRVMLGLQPIQR
ncbi:MAG: LamG domain-containing protein [bacterium]|nr:LamG domain-containing protein [bacterium]